MGSFSYHLATAVTIAFLIPFCCLLVAHAHSFPQSPTFLELDQNYEFRLYSSEPLSLVLLNVPLTYAGVLLQVHCLQCHLTMTVNGTSSTATDFGHVFRDIAKVIPEMNVSYNGVIGGSPVLIQVYAKPLSSRDVIPGGCAHPAQPHVTAFTADSATYIDVPPAQRSMSGSCAAPSINMSYTLLAYNLNGSSYSDVFEVLTSMRSPWTVRGLRVVSQSSVLTNDTIRFTDLPHLSNGVVYVAVVTFTSPQGKASAAYVPASSFHCGLDSTSNNTCQGILISNDTVTEELILNVPKTFTYSHFQQLEDSDSGYIIFQAHTQRSPFTSSYQAFAESSALLHDVHSPSLDTSMGLFLANTSAMLTSQYALKIIQSTVQSRIPVQVTVRGGASGKPTPGGCRTSGKVTQARFDPSIVRIPTSTSEGTQIFFEPARPEGRGVLLCIGLSADRFTYSIYRTVLQGNDLFSVAKYQSTVETMSTEHGLLSSPDAELLTSETSTPSQNLSAFPSEPETGEVYNVLVLDNELNSTAVYVPLTVYHCQQFVDPVLQYGSPCKVMLDRVDSSRVVAMVGQEIMTFHVNATPVASDESSSSSDGFVVVQTHTQLHRVQASPLLGPLLLPSTSVPRPDVVVSRSTGIVIPIGTKRTQFDYYAALLSVVQSNAKLLAAFYPVSAPLPGGCCANCKAADVVRSAKALLDISVNNTHVTVSFNDSALFMNGKWLCAHSVLDMHVTYDLYSLELNGTHEGALFDGLDEMYTAERVRSAGTKLRTFKALAMNYSASFPLQPGLGRVYSVVASAGRSEEKSVNNLAESCYIPASSYDCAYVESKDENDGQICKIVLEPNRVYRSSVNSSSHLSYILHDWQPAAAKWTFAIMSAHSQRHGLQTSLTFLPSLETSSPGTSTAVTKLLNTSGDNEHARLYVSPLSPSPSSHPSAEPTKANTNVQVIATPYGEYVPIPGGCCLTCSMDIDSTVNISFQRYITHVGFHPANAGYARGQPPACFLTTSSPQSHLIYQIYMYQMKYVDFSEDSMFTALARMSTVEGVLAHGTEVHVPAKDYAGLRNMLLTTRRGQGVVYNVLVRDPSNGLQAVYSPAVGYGCDLNGKVLGCDAIGSTFGKVVLTLAGLLGLIFTFFGHRLYPLEILVTGMILALLAFYPVLSLYTLLPFYAQLGISLFLAAGCGSVLLLMWYRTSWYRIIIMVLGLPPGLLFSGLLLFTPFGNLVSFHSSASYWMTFVAVAVWFPALLLYSPVKGNLLCTSWMGSYALILAVNQYMDTQLVFIVLDVIIHAVNPSYAKNEYHSYSLQVIDIALCVVWGLLTIGGALFQYDYLKKRDLLNIPLSSHAHKVLWEEYQQIESQGEDDDDDNDSSYNSPELGRNGSSAVSILNPPSRLEGSTNAEESPLLGSRTPNNDSVLGFFRNMFRRQRNVSWAASQRNQYSPVIV